MRDAALTHRFAANMRRIRLARDIGQEELGDLCSARHGYVAKLERGEQEPELLTVIRLAGCLATDADEFVTKDPPARPRSFAPPFQERSLERQEIAHILGATIREARSTHGISRRGVAGRAGVSAGALDGNSIPRLSVGVDIAVALETDLRHLLAGIVYIPARPPWRLRRISLYDRGAEIQGAFVPTIARAAA
jgi:transcriptional regulator with XRE-family HTH domain